MALLSKMTQNLLKLTAKIKKPKFWRDDWLNGKILARLMIFIDILLR